MIDTVVTVTLIARVVIPLAMAFIVILTRALLYETVFQSPDLAVHVQVKRHVLVPALTVAPQRQHYQTPGAVVPGSSASVPHA